MLKLSHSHRLSYPALKAALMLKSFILFGVFAIFAADTSACCYDSSQDRSASVSVSVSSDEAGDTAQDISDESGSVAVSGDAQNNQDASRDISNMSDSGAPDSSEANSGIGNANSQPAWAQRSKRRNMLVQKWRSEFARMDVFDVPTNQPLDVDDIKFQLERIQSDLPESIKSEIAVLGSDLTLLEEWMNDALDRRIPQKPSKRKRQFTLFRPPNLDAEGILNKLAMLESKRELLVYGNNALQGMGLFVK